MGDRGPKPSQPFFCPQKGKGRGIWLIASCGYLPPPLQPSPSGQIPLTQVSPHFLPCNLSPHPASLVARNIFDLFIKMPPGIFTDFLIFLSQMSGKELREESPFFLVFTRGIAHFLPLPPLPPPNPNQKIFRSPFSLSLPLPSPSSGKWRSAIVPFGFYFFSGGDRTGYGYIVAQRYETKNEGYKSYSKF